MIAPVPSAAPSLPAVLSDQYIASYGKSGGLGCFTVAAEACFARGQHVLLRTPRGLEVGVILGGATLRQARLLGALAAGEIVRPLAADDEEHLRRQRHRSDEVFALARRLAADRRLPAEILDVELLADDRHAIVHLAGRTDDGLTDFAAELARRVGLEVCFENLALAGGADEAPSHGGCGKPDCGKTEGGGCSSCGAGGCSSCGSGPVDLRPYFEHLRAKMESQQRTPLL